MAVNYNDRRFEEVESDKKVAINEVDGTYGEIIGDVDAFYDKQIEASENYAEEQKKNHPYYGNSYNERNDHRFGSGKHIRKNRAYGDEDGERSK